MKKNSRPEKVVVIGAGPVGSYCAALLSKAFDVDLYEEHSVVGKPVQCTGLLSSGIYSLMKIPENTIVNKIKKIIINSKNRELKLKLKKPELIVDRFLFDNYFLNKALDSGVNVFFNHRFKSIRNNAVVFENEENKEHRFDVLIGADGVNSRVREVVFKKKVRTILGVQARIRGNFDQEYYQVFLDEKIKGFFWIVPENEEIARVGVCPETNQLNYFKKFCHKILGHEFDSRIIEYQSGLIPVYEKMKLEKKICNKRAFLIGDAAALVKATTFGGLIPGLQSAQILSECLIENKNFQHSMLRVRKNLWWSRKIRSVLDKFNNENYDKIIKIFEKPTNKSIIENFDRDNVIIILHSLIKEYRLWKYLPKLF